MSYTATVVTVMIASPSDVQKERDAIRQLIHEWNDLHSKTEAIVLLPLGWETHAAPTMGDRPQALINKQVLADADLLVAVFWTRLGSPTGKAASGTVEEIEEHISAGKPAMLYFSNADVPRAQIDHEQDKALDEFKQSCRPRGLVEEYRDLPDFKEKFRSHLTRTVRTNFSAPASPAPSSYDDDENDDVVPTLSPDAAKLLVDASQKGRVLIAKWMGGQTIQVSDEVYVEGNNRRVIARWEKAIDDLVNDGFLERESESLINVTHAGYELADKLVSKDEQAQ